MKIEKGLDGFLYVVFNSCHDAEEFDWLFSGHLGWDLCCFGQYENAYRIPMNIAPQ